jgi:hypothetical protein
VRNKRSGNANDRNANDRNANDNENSRSSAGSRREAAAYLGTLTRTIDP